MAQFIVMGIGDVVNAIVVSVSNALFSMSTESERQKEADAREKFQEDLAAWNQRKAERAEFLADRKKLLWQQLLIKNNKYFVIISTIFQLKQYTCRSKCRYRAKISDYYTPSDEQKTAKIIGITLGWL